MRDEPREIAVDQIRAISKQRLRRRHPLGDDPLSDAGSCESRTGCDVWIRDSEGDDEALNLWVQQIVKDDGWPLADDSVFVLDEALQRTKRKRTAEQVVGSADTLR